MWVPTLFTLHASNGLVFVGTTRPIILMCRDTFYTYLLIGTYLYYYGVCIIGIYNSREIQSFWHLRRPCSVLK